MKQIQEDLPQEKADNEKEPEKKKEALKAIIADYNARFRTNHAIGEFDLYYQDVQKRIKDQQFPNADLPDRGAEKIDITIVVDMLLTGFDSKFLNTLYVDKNLKHHGLIQAFSRTNRVLNATKPHGQILDFREQQDAVDAAITLFSGVENGSKAREIWLVDPAPKVVEKLKTALGKLDDFMQSQGLDPKPENVPALRGDEARAAFVERFREIQRLKIQLDQYTDLAPETQAVVDQLLPQDRLTAFRGVYLETAQRLRAEQTKPGAAPVPVVEDLEFEFVLFASADLDYFHDSEERAAVAVRDDWRLLEQSGYQVEVLLQQPGFTQSCAKARKRPRATTRRRRGAALWPPRRCPFHHGVDWLWHTAHRENRVHCLPS